MPLHIEKVPFEYKVVTRTKIAFERECLNLLKAGWEPVGGIGVFIDLVAESATWRQSRSTLQKYVQAFIKYEIRTTDTGPN
jgi:hypothetical protein